MNGEHGPIQRHPRQHMTNTRAKSKPNATSARCVRVQALTAWVSVACLLSAVGASYAQAGATTTAPAPGQRSGNNDGPYRLRLQDLNPVAPRASDVSSQDAGLAIAPRDLRVPNNFRGIYQIPKDAPTPYAGWFVRISGATWAVFPQSVYEDSDKGVIIQVPPGTQYFSGGIPLSGPLPSRNDASPLATPERIDSSVTNQEAVSPTTAAPQFNRVDTSATPGGVEIRRSALLPRRADDAAIKVRTSGGDGLGGQASDLQVRQALGENADRLMSDARYRERRLANLLAQTLPPGK